MGFSCFAPRHSQKGDDPAAGPGLANWAGWRTSPAQQHKMRGSLFMYCMNSNKMVDWWWWEVHLPLSPDRGGRGDSPYGCDVKNGGQEKRMKVVVWLCCNCYLTPELWEKTGLVQVLAIKRRDYWCRRSSCWQWRGEIVGAEGAAAGARRCLLRKDKAASIIVF